jgi:hypothetical protein
VVDSQVVAVAAATSAATSVARHRLLKW